jgi:phospholipid/cholesterol/gamma-HCH transport system substrate-binding protein
MGSNVNYTLVGLFVLLFTAGILGFAYWLARHGGEQEYDYYQVFMTESVAGLSTDAAVKYHGVDVGTVAEMGLNPDNPEQVRLLLKIRRGTPVKTDTTATLSFYGVTGLAFVELKGTTRDAPLLKAQEGSIPVIKSAPSAITRLDDALSTLAVKSTRALDRIDRLLSDENLENVATLIKDSRDMVHGLRNVARPSTISSTKCGSWCTGASKWRRTSPAPSTMSPAPPSTWKNWLRHCARPMWR